MASYLITGASRGYGLALVNELDSYPTSKIGTIFATARGDCPALKELEEKTSGRVTFIKLDVTDQASVKKAAAEVAVKLGGKGLDVLINSAGICLHSFDGIKTMDNLEESFAINVMGVHWVTREFLPLLQKGTQKKVINITTTFGSTSMAEENSYYPAPSYKISKAATNALTAQYAVEYEKEGFTFIALSPGWMKTELGGGDMADLTPEQGAKASLQMIFEEGQKYNGKLMKIYIEGWDNTKGRHKYDGLAAPF